MEMLQFYAAVFLYSAWRRRRGGDNKVTFVWRAGALLLGLG